MTDETPTPDEGTIADSVQSAGPTPTVAALLRQGYEKAQSTRPPKEVQLPGYGEPDSQLWVTFRALEDYEEARDAFRDKLKRKGGMSAGALEVSLGIETLRLAAVGSYALVNGERVEIGQPLGLGLYEYLFPNQNPGPSTDGEAIVLLFHSNTVTLMSVYQRVDRWIQRGGVDSEEEVLGE